MDGSERLTDALLDRFAYHPHMLKMDDESCRPKDNREDATPPSRGKPNEA